MPVLTPLRRQHRRLALPALLLPPLVAWAQAGAAQERPAGREGPAPALAVDAFTLENGMRFLVVERTTAPTVAFAGVVGVGGVNEALGSTGTAHLLEHLLFKGTRRVGTLDPEAEAHLFARMDSLHDDLLRERGRLVPDSSRLRALAEGIAALEDEARAYVVPNEFDRILTRAGAQGLNATTSSETTTYFVELPSNRAELWFALEADRMANPVFREFYTERDVVMEERRLRVETSPGGLLYEAHLAHAFTLHPYGVPVVGYMSDLERLSRAQVRDYFRRYYGPGNTVVAVVGDVSAARVRTWAERYFGGLPAGERPPPVLAREPEPRGERRVEVLADAEPALRLGWHIPSATHPDAPALAMLAALLTGGRTARLHRAAVDDARLATWVAAGTGPGDRHPRLFTVDLVPRAPHTPEEGEALVREVVAAFARTPPPEEDLERVRSQLAAGAVRRLRSNLGLALQLAEAEVTLGDWREAFGYADAIGAVTGAEVQAVARRYLTPERLTVAVLRRRGGDEER
ncbi:MAG: pitrilysin family protein [Longimicrobiales bacterium]|nr:pitrilysin family protein [Longimicrobiales bacterium]